MKKIYPAVFHPEDKGYSVSFPDLPGCFSEGDNLEDAITMAEEALGLYLASRFDSRLEFAAPSNINDVDSEDGFVSYVSADVGHYMKRGKSVKKTLTIPEWLNFEAEKAGVNFSATLQDAIRARLGI